MVGTVASQKVLGSVPGWRLHVLPVSVRGFGALVFPTIIKTCIGLISNHCPQPESTDEGLDLVLGSCIVAANRSSRSNAENTFHCIVFM